jgi:sialic acid synthase SpsE
MHKKMKINSILNNFKSLFKSKTIQNGPILEEENVRIVWTSCKYSLIVKLIFLV